MLHDRANWRMTARRAALAAAALLFSQFDGAAVHAQAFARPPAINIPARTPSINPTVTPHIDTMRIDPNTAGRAVTGLDRTTSRIRSSCSYAYRDSDGE